MRHRSGVFDRACPGVLLSLQTQAQTENKPWHSVIWRQFSPHVDAIAAQYAASGQSEESFKIIGSAKSGHSGAVPVRMNSGRLAFAKPAKAVRDYVGQVAREKIAADLGFALGLPVSPVIISRQTDGLSAALPSVVALSFPVLAAGKLPSELDPPMTTAERDRLHPTNTALLAFHAWIDDHDHRWNWNHLVERREGESIELASFDYEHSLDKVWVPPGPHPPRTWVPPDGNLAILDRPPDPVAAEAVIAMIISLTAGEISTVLANVPDDCLPQARRDALVSGLIGRAKDLRTVLKLEQA